MITESVANLWKLLNNEQVNLIAGKKIFEIRSKKKPPFKWGRLLRKRNAES